MSAYSVTNPILWDLSSKVLNSVAFNDGKIPLPTSHWAQELISGSLSGISSVDAFPWVYHVDYNSGIVHIEYSDSFLLTLEMDEPVIKLIDLDSLTATIDISSRTSGKIEAIMSRGCPFASFVCTNATPSFACSKENWAFVDEIPIPATVRGRKFVIKNSSSDSVYVLYTESEVSLEINSQSFHFTKPFSGIFQIARPDENNSVKVYDKYAGMIPVECDVSYSIKDGKDVSYSFQFTTLGINPSKTLAWYIPHHLSKSTTINHKNTGLSLSDTFYGDISAIEISKPYRINFSETFSPMGWFGDPISDEDKKENILTSLRSDIKTISSQQVFAITRLCIIGEELSYNPKEDITNAYNAVKNVFEKRFQNEPIFSEDIESNSAEYLYALAACVREDPKWGKKWKEDILMYARFACNSSSTDPYFPVFRYKDWYMRNMQARPLSKDLTSYYALWLLGKEFKMKEMTDAAALLISTSLREANPFIKEDRTLITPASKHILKPQYVNKVRDSLRNEADSNPYAAMALSVLSHEDAEKMWKMWKDVDKFHENNSPTNIKWWIASQNHESRNEKSEFRFLVYILIFVVILAAVFLYISK